MYNESFNEKMCSLYSFCKYSSAKGGEYGDPMKRPFFVRNYDLPHENTFEIDKVYRALWRLIYWF